MQIYSNEILISALARKAQNEGESQIKPSNRRLFGMDHKKISIDLPSSIGSLIDSGVLTNTPAEIVQNHTLFPFFQPFLNEWQALKVWESMIGNGGNAVHFTSGIMASVVKRYPCLKLCPKCLIDDLQVHGEPYWHVDHQIPGMTICVKHKCSLISYCKICNAELAGVCPTYCPNGHDLILQADYEDGSTVLGYLSNELINVFSICQNGLLKSAEFHHLYQSRLKQLGYCSERGRVKQLDITRKLTERFHDRILKSICVPLPIGADTWLSSMLRKPRRSFHPLLHVLVILCLWGEVENFFSELQANKGSLIIFDSRSSQIPKISNSLNQSRVDWLKRDKLVAVEINQALLDLRSQQGKPIRITVTKVGKHIHKLGLLERQLKKMPLSLTLLEHNLDSEEQHQKNKIKWAVDELLREGVELSKWRVLRKAGIRVATSKGVEEYVTERINELFLRFVA